MERQLELASLSKQLGVQGEHLHTVLQDVIKQLDGVQQQVQNLSSEGVKQDSKYEGPGQQMVQPVLVSPYYYVIVFNPRSVPFVG